MFGTYLVEKNDRSLRGIAGNVRCQEPPLIPGIR